MKKLITNFLNKLNTVGKPVIIGQQQAELQPELLFAIKKLNSVDAEINILNKVISKQNDLITELKNQLVNLTNRFEENELAESLQVDSIRTIQKDNKTLISTINKQDERIKEVESKLTSNKPDNEPSNSAVIKAAADVMLLIHSHRKQMNEHEAKQKARDDLIGSSLNIKGILDASIYSSASTSGSSSTNKSSDNRDLNNFVFSNKVGG